MDDFAYKTESLKRAAREFVDAIGEWEERPDDRQALTTMAVKGVALAFVIGPWCELVPTRIGGPARGEGS